MDRLQSACDQVGGARNRLSFVLAAVHALAIMTSVD
ncbi:hypothetical protein QFZ67_000369 [Streptomyces sp. V1I1]|nr:hypothetical protein [Streptomyces sp. V1I1]